MNGDIVVAFSRFVHSLTMKKVVTIFTGLLTRCVVSDDDIKNLNVDDLFSNLEEQLASGMTDEEIIAANTDPAVEPATDYDMSGTSQHCHQPTECERNEALDAYCCKPVGCSFDLEDSLSSNESPFGCDSGQVEVLQRPWMDLNAAIGTPGSAVAGRKDAMCASQCSDAPAPTGQAEETIESSEGQCVRYHNDGLDGMNLYVGVEAHLSLRVRNPFPNEVISQHTHSQFISSTYIHINTRTNF